MVTFKGSGEVSFFLKKKRVTREVKSERNRKGRKKKEPEDTE